MPLPPFPGPPPPHPPSPPAPRAPAQPALAFAIWFPIIAACVLLNLLLCLYLLRARRRREAAAAAAAASALSSRGANKYVGPYAHRSALLLREVDKAQRPRRDSLGPERATTLTEIILDTGLALDMATDDKPGGEASPTRRAATADIGTAITPRPVGSLPSSSHDSPRSLMDSVEELAQARRHHCGRSAPAPARVHASPPARRHQRTRQPSLGLPMAGGQAGRRVRARACGA